MYRMYFVLPLIFCAGCAGRLASTPFQQEDDRVARSIRKAMEDGARLERLHPAIGSHIGQFLPAKFWFACFPYNGTTEKLISEGASIVGPLKRVTVDQSREPDIRDSAFVVLGYFEPEALLKKQLNDANEHRIRPIDLFFRLAAILPVGDDFRGLPKETISKWVEDKLATVGFEQMVLQMLDDVMRSKESRPQPADPRIMFWLNRVYDQDIDELLAKRAPAALKFRNKALANGYDPLAFDAFPLLFSDNLLETVVNRVYTLPEDRVGCLELISTIYGSNLLFGPVPKAPPGWRDRLHEWFTANRKALHYDIHARRFVVQH